MSDLGSVPSMQLGKYRLLGELGRGGMAHVFLAMATGPARFSKLVVVKEIQASLAHEPEFVTMFLDEARLAARLNHPNVVQTNEVGQEDYRFYMVMEYLEGQSFRTVLRRIGRGPDAPLTLGMKLRVVCDALAGLHHAHDLTDFVGQPLGVVHRDVSPHNIFVTYSGQVKVLDFGIAKAFDSVTTTSTGVLKGKVAYMAPEHARGDRVDRRADVYAAGIVLWECVTGERLFQDQPQVAILNKLLSGDLPRIRDVAPDIDPRLEAIISKALAYRPDDRYPTAAAFAADIEDMLRAQGDMSTNREIGVLVEGAFVKERARITQLVETQIARMAQAPTPDAVQPVAFCDPEASTSSMLAAANPATAVTSLTPPTMSGISVVSSPSATTQSPPRAVWPWMTAVALIAGMAGAYVIFREPEPGPSTAKSDAEASFTLRLTSNPDGANVRCDGEIVGKTPFDVSINAGNRPCTYVVLLDGHQPYTVEQGPVTGNTTIMANLLPAGSATAAPTATSTNATAPTPRLRPQPVETPPPVVPPPGPPKDDIPLRR